MNIKIKVLVVSVVFLGILNFLWISLFLQGGFPPAGELKPPKQTFTFLSQYFGAVESYVTVEIEETGNLSLEIHGHRKFNLSEIDKYLNRGLHISEELSLFSLVYLNQILKNSEKTFTLEQYRLIVFAVEKTLSYIEKKTLFPVRMKFNDHVSSARLEALILFYAYINEYHNELLTVELENKLSKHILWCNKLLAKDSHFTWRTNHGLMQIRALLTFALTYPDPSHSSKGIIAVKERIPILLDYHIADDGSVYESASSYWYYIFQLWKGISSFPVLDLKLQNTIKSRLDKTKFFLKTVTSPDGFLQGIGDAVNIKKNILSFEKFNSINTYRFANGLAGINYYDTSGNILRLLFISLHNPPNVHKHPEDLSLYLYYNKPYFINSGVFSYDGSWQRDYVKSQKAQNTVFSDIQSIPDSSMIFEVEVKDSNITIYGIKYYGKEFIKRTIHFKPGSGIIQIFDEASESSLNMKTVFNIHPDFSIDRINRNNVKITDGKQAIRVSSTKDIIKDFGYVSQSNNDLTEIEKININGDTSINTVIELPIKIIKARTEIIINSEASNTRNIIAQKLSQKYKSHLFQKQSLKRLVYPRFIFFVFYIISIALLAIFNRNKVLKVVVLSSFCSLVYIIDIIFNGILLSLSFF